jgi:hypothetical protein
MTVCRHGVERLTGDPYEPFGRGVPVSDHWSYSTLRGLANPREICLRSAWRR